MVIGGINHGDNASVNAHYSGTMGVTLEGNIGANIFDFTLAPDSLKVNSCVEPMRRPKVLALLERDLRVILMDRNRAKLKKQTPGLELRKSGHGFSKSVFTIIYNAEGNIDQVLIKHPWIRLRMTLEELKNDSKD